MWRFDSFITAYMIWTMFFIFFSVFIWLIRWWNVNKRKKIYLDILKSNNQAITKKLKINEFREHYSWWEDSVLDWNYIYIYDWSKTYRKLIKSFGMKSSWCPMSDYNKLKKLWVEHSTDKEVFKKSLENKLSELNNKLQQWQNLFKSKKIQKNIKYLNYIIENIDNYIQKPSLIMADGTSISIDDDVIVYIDPTDWWNYEIQLNTYVQNNENSEWNIQTELMDKYQKELTHWPIYEIFTTIGKFIIIILIIIIIFFIISNITTFIDRCFKMIWNIIS